MVLKRRLFPRRGFAVIGVAVALAILASMALGFAKLSAINQHTRVSQLYMDQAFYVSQGALEFAMRSIKVDGASTVPSRQFLGSTLTATRSGGKINVTTSYGNSGYVAVDSASITDPGNSAGPSCIYVLASSGSGRMSLSGSANLASSTCSARVNSSSATAVTLSGSASLNVYALKIVGGYSTSGSSSITTNSGTVNTGQSAVADPLLAYNIPSYSACNFTNLTISGSGSTTLNPGVYCGGLSISGSPTVTFNPGNYIIDGANFSVSGSPTITANDVTIFLNRQLGTSYARVTISGSPNFTLNSPTTGTYAGIAFFQSRSAASANNTISGSAALRINGVIYLPMQTLTISGSASSTAPCTMLVVNRLTISGSPNISCASGALGGLVH